MENIFDIVKRKLHQDDLEMKKIECEGFEGFSAQVKTKLESVPVAVLDWTIWLMEKQIDLIVKRKQQRIK